ncbi:MAG: hypothetical protein ACK42I_05430 [Thermomicrobium sp.]
MAVRPVPEEPPTTQSERALDPTATWELLERVNMLVEKLRQRRFVGEDPVVEIPSATKRRVSRATLIEEALIAALAAERLGALLDLSGTLVSLAEDVAAEELATAYRALSTWDLRGAETALARALRVTRFPEHQQRIALGWALHHLVSDLLRFVPGESKEKSLPAERLVAELLPTLDHLPQDERAFYQGEVSRLAAAWRQAATDDQCWCVWALFRARVALLRGEGPETTLAWLLRLARRAGLTASSTRANIASSGNSLTGDDPDGLVTLLRRAEAVFQLLITPSEQRSAGESLAAPPADESAPSELHKLAAEASPRDLFRALVAVLTAQWGEDALAATQRFALAIWVPEASSTT